VTSRKGKTLREVFLLSPNGNYIKHTYPGSSQSGNASWSVQWTAPASAVHDPVTFYVAGNEANAILRIRVDYIYTDTAQVSSAAATPVTSPTVLPTLPPLPLTGASPMLPHHHRHHIAAATIASCGSNFVRV